MLLGFGLAIGSAISGAVANILARRIVREIRARDMVSVNFLLMTVMLLPGLPWLWHAELTPDLVVRIAIAIMLDSAGNILYFYTFEKLEPVVASAMLSVSPLLGLLVAPFFTDSTQSLGIGQVVGVVSVTAGLAILAWIPFRTAVKNGGKRSAREWFISVGTPVLAALLFTISIFVMRADLSANHINSYSYYLLRAPFIAFITAMLTRPNLSWVTPRALWVTSGRMIFVLAQWLLLLTAIQIGNTVVVKALADSTPFFVILISWAEIKRMPPKEQWLGAAFVVGGILLISLR